MHEPHKMIKNLVQLTALFLMPLMMTGQCIGEQGQVSWLIWDNDTPIYGLEHLQYDDTYPNGPDQLRILNSTATECNYDNDYSSVVRGFISPDLTGTYLFNITGDDIVHLFVSEDAQYPDYSDTTAISPGFTGENEHSAYPSQTSAPIQLVAGAQYYFEMHHFEGSGGDCARLFWDLPGGQDSAWQIVSSPFLYDVCDSICLPQGTACDDGDPNTIDDQEDGFCNCLGRPDVSAGLNVGERGQLETYVYDNIPSAPLEDLYTHPNYPTAPDQMFIHDKGLSAFWEDDLEETGLLMKGFIQVPESGNYDFNITGVGETTFRINRAHNAIGVTDSIFSHRYYMEIYEHERDDIQSGEQTINGLSLNPGRLYYFEVIQKNPDYGNRFTIFWNGPQHDDDRWHRIAPVNIYNYDDPLLCVPIGTPCDDGNPLTANDQIDNDCNCVGTPCTPLMDCDDPAADLITYDYCEVADQISNNESDAWLSCQSTPSPYIADLSTANYHWIHYDLGNEYLLGQTHVWNYNVAGSTNLGFTNVAVHYSIDNEEWFFLGFYTWDDATGDDNYSGFSGPDFGQVSARYVLFTDVIPTSECRGISKITFDADLCQDRGSICDDGDISTFNDQYDDRCQCIGYTVEELDCVIDTLFIYEDNIPANEYHAIKALMSDGGVLNENEVNYRAGMEIVLNSGFEVELGGTLTAEIEGCPDAAIAMIDSKSDEKFLKRTQRPNESIQVYDLEGSDIQTIRIYLPEAAKVGLSIYDNSGTKIYTSATYFYQDHGDHYKRINTHQLDAGVYTVQMDTPSGSYRDKMTVL